MNFLQSSKQHLLGTFLRPAFRNMLGSGDDHPISMVESGTKTKSNIFKPPTTIDFID